MTSSDWPLQKAVFALLDGDSTLDALIGNNRIFDRVPDEQAFDYVVIGGFTASDLSTFGKLIEDVTFQIDVWSQKGGKKTCALIQDRLDTLVNRASLDLSADGFRLLSVLREFRESLLDPDGLTYHGIQRFRAMVEKV